MKDSNKVSASEITPAAAYFSRRMFIQTGVLASSAVVTGLVYRHLNPVATGKIDTPVIEGLTKPASADADAAGFRVTEPPTSLQDITHYNNFYEFSTDKDGVAPAAANFETKAGKCRSRVW